MTIKIQKFLIYIFSLTLVFESWQGLSISGNSIPKLVAIVLVLSLIFLGGKRSSYSSIRFYIYPLIVLGFTLIVTTMYNFNNDQYSMVLMPGVILNIILFILILRFVQSYPIAGYKMLQMLAIGILIVSVLYIFNIGVDYEDGRLTIFGENSNKIGIYAIIAFVFVLSTVFENPLGYSRMRYYLLIALGPLINMIAQSGSRVTFISFLLILLMFFALKGGKNSLRKVVFFVVGLIVVYLMIDYLLSFEVLRNRVFDTIKDKDLAGRDIIWENFLPLFLHNPVFGVGLSGYAEESVKIYQVYYSPHNVFLEVALYTGIIGLIAFLVVIFRVLRQGYRVLKAEKYILPFLLMFLIVLVCFSGQMLNVKPYWMIMAFILSVPVKQTQLSQYE